MNAIQFHLKRLSAPRSALMWAGTQDNPNNAWNACPRGDWLLCLAVKLGVEHRVVVLAACACARLGLPFTRDERPLEAILKTEAWITGDTTVTVQDVRDAARDCDEAAGDAGCFADYAASNTAYAAMYAAIAALPGATPEGAAAAAAGSVAEAAADASTSQVDGDLARIAMWQACANAVRSKIDEAVVMQAWWEYVTGSTRED